MKQDDLDYLFRFFGYGDPHSNLWFVGIEEGGEQGQIYKQSHQDFYIGDENVRFDPRLPTQNKSSNKVWEISQELAQIGDPNTQPATYFLSNIAPVARKCVGIRHAGIDPKAYFDRIVEERVRLLVSASRAATKRAIVFHGVAGWRGYRVMEAFGRDAGVVLHKETGIYYSDSERVVFTPTFSWGNRHFGTARRDKVASLLRRWTRA